ncbi:unnamed protein product [Prunus brigantina]
MIRLFVVGLLNQPIMAERGTYLGQSDGRMIYGVNEAITGMMLRRLQKSRVV